jgi:hypothetical protein
MLVGGKRGKGRGEIHLPLYPYTRAPGGECERGKGKEERKHHSGPSVLFPSDVSGANEWQGPLSSESFIL